MRGITQHRAAAAAGCAAWLWKEHAGPMRLHGLPGSRQGPAALACTWAPGHLQGCWLCFTHTPSHPVHHHTACSLLPGHPPVGKSGAGMCCISSLVLMPGCSTSALRPATTSRRL